MLPLSLVYGLIVAVRNKCYDWQIFHSLKLPVSVVSVGNITVGGTGKTPLVAYIAQYLRRRGKRVAILSRGYKRRSFGFVLVSDGEKNLVDSSRSGDEPYELAQTLPGVIVAVDERRARAGMKVIQQFPVDVVVLDDGFQHRVLQRNLDIVTIPSDQNESWRRPSRLSKAFFTSFYYRAISADKLLPAGLQREPLRNLRRAQHIVFTRANMLTSEGFQNLQAKYRQYSIADASAIDYRMKNVVRISDGNEYEAQKFRGKRILVFCGIQDPENFSRLAVGAGFEVVYTVFFPDHYEYRDKDFVQLRKSLSDSLADCFLTTMKDAARLLGTNEGEKFVSEAPVYALLIGIEFIHGKEVFHQHLDRLIA